MPTQQKNGNPIIATPKQNGNEKTVATVVTLPVKKEEEKAKPAADGMPPVEDRIHKVHQLISIVEKHETLLEAQQKLNSFKLSSDGSRDTLSIQDSKGRAFTTTNSLVIADVVETLKKSIAEKIAAVEKQIEMQVEPLKQLAK